jgi:DNA topoisomerase-1
MSYDILEKLFSDDKYTSKKNTSKKLSKKLSKKPSKKKQKGGGFKWTTLEHNGVLFPSEYKAHNIPLLYNNQYVQLDPKQEEAAMLYAKYIYTDYIENKTFNSLYKLYFLKKKHLV